MDGNAAEASGVLVTLLTEQVSVPLSPKLLFGLSTPPFPPLVLPRLPRLALPILFSKNIAHHAYPTCHPLEQRPSPLEHFNVNSVRDTLHQPSTSSPGLPASVIFPLIFFSTLTLNAHPLLGSQDFAPVITGHRLPMYVPWVHRCPRDYSITASGLSLNPIFIELPTTGPCLYMRSLGSIFTVVRILWEEGCWKDRWRKSFNDRH